MVDMGYEGPTTKKEEEGSTLDPEAVIILRLERVLDMHSSEIRCRFVRNGVPCGIIHLKHEWEFEQLKFKVDDEYTPRGFMGVP